MILDIIKGLWGVISNEGLHRILRTGILLGMLIVLQHGFQRIHAVETLAQQMAQLRGDFKKLEQDSRGVFMYVRNVLDRNDERKR